MAYIFNPNTWEAEAGRAPSSKPVRAAQWHSIGREGRKKENSKMMNIHEFSLEGYTRN